MMGLVDYLSRNPYQTAKIISNFDQEFLVATLSQIQRDANLIQKVKPISAVHLNKFCLANKLSTQIPTTKQLNNNDQVFNIDSATPVHLPQNILPLAGQNTIPKLTSIINHNLITDHALQVSSKSINTRHEQI